MAELVDATDLKSVGDFLRAGSIPAFRTNNKSLHKFCVDSFLLFWGGLKRFLILNFERKKPFVCVYSSGFYYILAQFKIVLRQSIGQSWFSCSRILALTTGDAEEEIVLIEG